MSQYTRQAEYPETQSPDEHREVRLETERAPRFGLSVPQILAGALAAASAAVAASWLGVAGTVLGAIVASVVVSITSAVYSHPIEKSTQVIREVLPVRPDPYRLNGSGSMSTETLVLDASTDVEKDPAEPTELTSTALRVNPPRTDRSDRRRVSWGTVLVSSVLTLIVGFGVLTAFEAVLGQSVSSLTGDNGGGSTVGHIFDGGSANSDSSDSNGPDTPAPTTGNPTDEAPTTNAPTDSPTTDDPTTTDPSTPPTTEPTPTEPTQTQPSGASPTGDDVDRSELAAAAASPMVS